jgi:hypothetical protein
VALSLVPFLLRVASSFVIGYVHTYHLVSLSCQVIISYCLCCDIFCVLNVVFFKVKDFSVPKHQAMKMHGGLEV